MRHCITEHAQLHPVNIGVLIKPPVIIAGILIEDLA
jgi:hypothetical protein